MDLARRRRAGCRSLPRPVEVLAWVLLLCCCAGQAGCGAGGRRVGSAGWVAPSRKDYQCGEGVGAAQVTGGAGR